MPCFTDPLVKCFKTAQITCIDLRNLYIFITKFIFTPKVVEVILRGSVYCLKMKLVRKSIVGAINTFKVSDDPLLLYVTCIYVALVSQRGLWGL